MMDVQPEARHADEVVRVFGDPGESEKGPTTIGRAGLSPVRMFYKNYCSTAMHSLVGHGRLDLHRR